MLFDVGENFLLRQFSVNLAPLGYFIQHLNHVSIDSLTDEKVNILGIVAEADFV